MENETEILKIGNWVWFKIEEHGECETYAGMLLIDKIKDIDTAIPKISGTAFVVCGESIWTHEGFELDVYWSTAIGLLSPQEVKDYFKNMRLRIGECEKKINELLEDKNEN